MKAPFFLTRTSKLVHLQLFFKKNTVIILITLNICYRITNYFSQVNTDGRQNQSVSLSKEVYSIIKSKIISGEFSQGEIINTSTISEKLKVSRTPIIYAFNRLELEGIVKIIPKVGVQIKVLSVVDIKNIYEFRAAIETYIAKKVIDFITESEIDLLKESLRVQEENINEIKSFREEDLNFHMILARVLNNVLFENALKDTFDKTAFIYSNYMNDIATSVSAHKRIVDYICAKDKEGLVQELEQHIMRMNFLKRSPHHFIDQS